MMKNKFYNVFVALACYWLCISCSSTENTTAGSVHYENISPFAVSYEKLKMPLPKDYDLLIVEPNNYNKSEVNTLRSSSATVLAYISLGEVNENRWYFSLLQDAGFLGKNENWDSYYLNLEDPGTYSLFFDEIIPEIMIRGFDGLFLDTVDDVAPYSSRDYLQDDMIRLIKQIRKEYPDIMIIQNAGLFLLDSTASSVNAVLVEDIATHFDFTNNTYELKDEKSYRDKIQTIKSASKRNKLPFLIVDFATNDSLRSLARQRLDSLRFPYFINNIGLNNISSGITGNNY